MGFEDRAAPGSGHPKTGVPAGACAIGWVIALLSIACGTGGDEVSGGQGAEGPIQTGAGGSSSSEASSSSKSSAVSSATGSSGTCTIDSDCVPGNVCKNGACTPDPIVTVCANRSLNIFPLSKTGTGDTEFNGHGPHVTLAFELTRTASKVTIEACVTMAETQSDWTKGEKCASLPIDVDSTELVSPASFTYEYIDSDHEPDNVFTENASQMPNEVVTGATCIGDRVGDDICSDAACSKCTVEIGCIRVKQ